MQCDVNAYVGVDVHADPVRSRCDDILALLQSTLFWNTPGEWGALKRMVSSSVVTPRALRSCVVCMSPDVVRVTRIGTHWHATAAHLDTECNIIDTIDARIARIAW